MKISEIISETASCGATSSGAIATIPTASVNLKRGQFFGGDPSSSIYAVKKGSTKNRKKKVAESLDNFKVDAAKEAGFNLDNQKEGRCVQCGLDGLNNCYSDAGRREFKISGLCEKCFDEIFDEDEI